MAAAAQAARTGNTRAVAAIGAFDGVHRGHQMLLRGVVERAEQLAARSVCVTFDPDPERVLRPEHAPLALCSVAERTRLVQALGVAEIYVWPFTEAVARMSPEDFVSALCARYPLAEVWVGTNFAFGHERSGTVETLAALGREHGFGVQVVAPVIDGGRPVSSTRVRGLLADGDVREAARLLGRYYELAGEVIAGARRGRQLGFPTANLLPPAGQVLPAQGVYAGLATVDGQEHAAVANVGSRPTFGEEQPLIEVHLLDFSGDVYGHRLGFAFVERVRAVVRFESLEALKAQIGLDITRARDLVASAPAEP
jgi:riboflavin kinase / FMN adenylyltransferase